MWWWLAKRILMARIFSILKRVGLIAGRTVTDIAASSNPLIGGLVDLISKNILNAEASLGPGNGPAKKDMVMNGVDSAAPLILRLAEMGAGKDLADDALFAQGIDKMTDGMVDIMNAFRILPVTITPKVEVKS